MTGLTSPTLQSPTAAFSPKAAQVPCCIDTYETIPLHNQEDDEPKADLETPVPPAASPRPPLQALRRTSMTGEKEEADEEGDGVRRAGLLTQLTSCLLDSVVPFGLYFGVGMNPASPDNVVLGGILAGASTVVAMAFRHYRFTVQRTIRVYPKVEQTCLSFMWVANALFVSYVPLDIARHFTLVVFSAGILLAHLIALLVGRPVFLEAALENQPPPEAKHRNYRRLYWRTSIAVTVVAAVQMVSIILGSVGPYRAEKYKSITLLMVPLGALAVTAPILFFYTRRELRMMRKEVEQTTSPRLFGMELSVV